MIFQSFQIYFIIIFQNIFVFSYAHLPHICSEKQESINDFGFFLLAQNPHRKEYSRHILFTHITYDPNACPNSVGRSKYQLQNVAHMGCLADLMPTYWIR